MRVVLVLIFVVVLFVVLLVWAWTMLSNRRKENHKETIEQLQNSNKFLLEKNETLSTELLAYRNNLEWVNDPDKEN